MAAHVEHVQSYSAEDEYFCRIQGLRRCLIHHHDQTLSMMTCKRPAQEADRSRQRHRSRSQPKRRIATSVNSVQGTCPVAPARHFRFDSLAIHRSGFSQHGWQGVVRLVLSGKSWPAFRDDAMCLGYFGSLPTQCRLFINPVVFALWYLVRQACLTDLWPYGVAQTHHVNTFPEHSPQSPQGHWRRFLPKCQLSTQHGPAKVLFLKFFRRSRGFSAKLTPKRFVPFALRRWHPVMERFSFASKDVARSARRRSRQTDMHLFLAHVMSGITFTAGNQHLIETSAVEGQIKYRNFTRSTIHRGYIHRDLINYRDRQIPFPPMEMAIAADSDSDPAELRRRLHYEILRLSPSKLMFQPPQSLDKPPET